MDKYYRKKFFDELNHRESIIEIADILILTAILGISFTVGFAMVWFIKDYIL